MTAISKEQRKLDANIYAVKFPFDKRKCLKLNVLKGAGEAMFLDQTGKSIYCIAQK